MRLKGLGFYEQLSASKFLRRRDARETLVTPKRSRVRPVGFLIALVSDLEGNNHNYLIMQEF